MGEVRQLRWWYLADLDRKYPARTSQPIRSSGSPPTPSASSPELPGSRPLPPSMSSARELFIVGRRFTLKLPQWHPYASRPITVLRQTPTALLFVMDGDHKLVPGMHSRRLAWAEVESHIEKGYVYWLNSIMTPEQRERVLRQGRQLQRTRRWARHPSGPAPSSS